MKKVLLFLATSMMAMGAMAQQWSGATNTTDEIHRYGTVTMLPTESGVPYSELTSSHFKVYRYYGTDYPWESVEVAWDGIHFRRTVPATSGVSDIGHGTFSFSNWIGGESKFFKLTTQGINSNVKIECTDSVLANNLKVTNNIRAYSINATNTDLINLRINAATLPSGFRIATNGKSYFSDYVGIGTSLLNTTFKFAVSGKSYFSDFVGIGTSNLSATSGFKLAVDGGILCEEVKVIANVPSADYVFDENYKLHSIAEVADYVKENKHLPDVPSAKDFQENGYRIGDMDNLLLQKIEELTLYIIEQQKQINDLQEKLNK